CSRYGSGYYFDYW
nr:immunoglobulin heavy chain junction region [Mus musculus]MBK4184504.1 immunoglobulin heavy chain junction region [Mus musculus]